MSLIISDTKYIDNLDLWEASINPLPNIDYVNLDYDEKSVYQYFCSDLSAIGLIKSCFTNEVISQKISEPYTIEVEIQKNLPGFELIPHFDNNEMLGVIIINLIDSGTSTEFYNNQNLKIGQAPITVSDGIMYLNNWDFKHGYKNSSNNNRYIAICMIYKV